MYDCGCGGHKGEQDHMPYMHMMNIPSQYQPMATMPQEELEAMYPKIYYQVYPAVQGYCDMMGIRPGMMYSPTKIELDNMVEGICQSVEGQVEMEENTMMDNMMMDNMDNRQIYPGFGFGRRRFLRDLVGILLIRELLRRRRPYGYPGFLGYPGYY